MKYIIILGDGMADEPIAELGGKTPLETADTPAMDWLTAHGQCGQLHTVPEGYEPGSEIANLTILGYDVRQAFEGRGSLEAASMNIPIEKDEMALRCNLICIRDGIIKNHSAGHITDEEAGELIGWLQKHLGNENVRFFPGVSYRHLLKIKGGNKQIHCTPPHDVPGTPFREVLVRATAPQAETTAELLNRLIIRSQELLAAHPVNLHRIAAGKDPANSIWPWSPGYKPDMQPLSVNYPVRKGVVISAVDLIKGIGVYAGLKPVRVEGATGLYDTNYEGKAAAAIEALKTNDFVYLHIEASDEAGHEGDFALKVRTIEYLDHRILKPLLQALPTLNEEVTVALLPDHPTPCRLRTHTADPVPFVIYRPGGKADAVRLFNEHSVKDGIYGTVRENEFINLLFHPITKR